MTSLEPRTALQGNIVAVDTDHEPVHAVRNWRFRENDEGGTTMCGLLFKTKGRRPEHASITVLTQKPVSCLQCIAESA